MVPWFTYPSPESKSRIERKARLMSRVKSEVESPYLTEFTIRTVSSQVSTGMTDVTGPKISSMAMRASGFTSVKMVGWKKLPLSSPPSRAASPPITRSASLRPMAAYAAMRSTALSLMTGPTSVFSSRPSPSTSPATRLRRASTNWSCTDRCTISRLAAVQRCPLVPKADQTAESRARSRSASSQMTIGFLPPSSRLTRLRVSAARRLISTPVSVWPVKLMTRTSGCSTMALPTSPPEPVTTLTTPSGMPPSISSSMKRTMHAGVSLAGFMTAVLPQMSAGKSFQPGMAIGKFQGVMIPTTPIGRRMAIANLSGISDGTVWPNRRRPSPAM